MDRTSTGFDKNVILASMATNQTGAPTVVMTRSETSLPEWAGDKTAFFDPTKYNGPGGISGFISKYLPWIVAAGLGGVALVILRKKGKI